MWCVTAWLLKYEFLLCCVVDLSSCLLSFPQQLGGCESTCLDCGVTPVPIQLWTALFHSEKWLSYELFLYWLCIGLIAPYNSLVDVYCHTGEGHNRRELCLGEYTDINIPGRASLSNKDNEYTSVWSATDPHPSCYLRKFPTTHKHVCWLYIKLATGWQVYSYLC